ncbi:MAG: glycosyltransferase family 4 protein, partial [Actinomycetota bacterium]|nr:glycosyltransferase family 4 protein [Actinomycetota bacterium]
MPLRVCLVTPFAWSQPHPVNDHVAGAAEALRERGHDVVVLAPSNRPRDLAAGRRALRQLALEGTPLSGTVALGPAVRLSTRSSLGVPVGARANLALALSADRFDVVHAHEPRLASLSYLALRQARSLTVATFHSPDGIAYPRGRAGREKLLARIDALTATSEAAAARERLPGDYRLLPVGVDTTLFRPGTPVRRFAVEWRPDEPERTRAALRALAVLPGWDLVVLRA